MRKSLIIGSLLALAGFVSLAQASDERLEANDPIATQVQRTASDDSRAERRDRQEGNDRSRERHDESSEGRRDSRERHDESDRSHERRDRR